MFSCYSMNWLQYLSSYKQLMGTKNQRTVYEWVNISDDLVYEWVRFFKGQEYEWGRFWNTSLHTRTTIISVTLLPHHRSFPAHPLPHPPHEDPEHSTVDRSLSVRSTLWRRLWSVCANTHSDQSSLDTHAILLEMPCLDICKYNFTFVVQTNQESYVWEMVYRGELSKGKRQAFQCSMYYVDPNHTGWGFSWTINQCLT